MNDVGILGEKNVRLNDSSSPQRILYSLQSLAYVNHSRLVGKSNRFPRRGNFLGPGGSGRVERFLILA